MTPSIPTCTSTGKIINVVQNLGLNDRDNYALNATGYSMFGGFKLTDKIQIIFIEG